MTTLASDSRLRAYYGAGFAVGKLEQGMPFEFVSTLPEPPLAPYGRVMSPLDPEWFRVVMGERLHYHGGRFEEDNPDSERAMRYLESTVMATLVGEMAFTRIEEGIIDETNPRWEQTVRAVAHVHSLDEEDYIVRLLGCIPAALLSVGDVETWQAIESLADFLLDEGHASFEQSRNIYERVTGRTVELVWG